MRAATHPTQPLAGAEAVAERFGPTVVDKGARGLGPRPE